MPVLSVRDEGCGDCVGGGGSEGSAAAFVSIAAGTSRRRGLFEVVLVAKCRGVTCVADKPTCPEDATPAFASTDPPCC